MTSTTLRSIIVGSLAAIVFANCGSDPYSGESTSATDTGTDTKTRTATDTTTPSATDTGTDTSTKTVTGTGTPSTTGTDTGTKTDTGTATKTDTGTPSGTGTATDTRTSTNTQTETLSGRSDGGPPDVPIVTETLTYTQTRTTTVITADGGTAGSDGGSYTIPLPSSPRLDLVFMIDNSPTMAPKVQKLKMGIPSLLAALKNPAEGTYPDLRIAIIDSDLGSGGQYASGSCGPNDSNNRSSWGDLGNFQVRGASGCGVNDGALWLEYTRGKAVNYDGKQDIGTVFGCLATNLGTMGCGLEHSLQAFEFALLAPSRDIPGRDPAQDGFLRQSTRLGLVFLTDEDDCSAATNDGMFGDSNHPELRGESASLRCATRSHMCSGQNLTDFGPGYPTAASFSTLLSNCQARTDACPNPTDGWAGGTSSTDTTGPTSCSPLKSVKHMADELKALKSDPEQIFVAGIFGWPRSDADMATAEYKIDLIPNPNSQDTAHPQVWDYWPVCYDPNHMPKSSGYDADAWAWGAQGGLRLSSFIDEFGANGQKYSICEPDFSAAMTGFGTAIARKMERSLCVPADLATGKTCLVNYRVFVTNADGTGSYVVGDSIAACPAGATSGAVSADCWRIVSDQTLCPDTGARVDLLRTAAEIAAGPLAEGTKLTFDCK